MIGEKIKHRKIDENIKTCKHKETKLFEKNIDNDCISFKNMTLTKINI